MHLESLLNDREELEIVESLHSSNHRAQEMTVYFAMINSFLTNVFTFSSTIEKKVILSFHCSLVTNAILYTQFLFHTENMQVAREDDSDLLHGRENLQHLLHNCDKVHFTVV